MSDDKANGALPITPYVKLPEEGDPYLEGAKCSQCGAIFLGDRDTCAACGARNSIEVIRLANTGKLYAFSIVHRSFPGVEVPYISAVVDLDGGGTVKGNLINIDPDPKNLSFDMPVRLVFKDAGRQDIDGNHYLSYFFEPA